MAGWIRSIGIGGKLAALMCALILTSSLGIGWSTYRRFNGELIQRELEALAQNTESAEQYLQAQFHAIYQVVDYLADLPAVRDALTAPSLESENAPQDVENPLPHVMEAIFKARPYYLSVAFWKITPDRRPEFVYRQKAASRVASQEVFPAARDGSYLDDVLQASPGMIVISDFRVVDPDRFLKAGVSGATTVFHAARTLHDPDDHPLGILILEVNLWGFVRHLAATLPPARRLYITDPGGFILANARPHQSSNAAFDGSRPIQDVFKELRSCFEEAPHSPPRSVAVSAFHRSQDFVVGFNKLFFDPGDPNRFLGIMMVESYQSITADAIAARNHSFWVALLFMGIALMVGWAFARSLTHPLRDITEAVEAFGRGAPHPRLPCQAKDEAGVLARAFREMVRQVNERTRALAEEMRDRQKAEKEKEVAQAAERAKTQFLANMSHEIRTPMTAILGFAETLQDSDPSDEARRNAVEAIQRNGRYLLELINDILDLSKVEEGKMVMEYVSCSPCQVVAEVISMARVRADPKGVSFRVEYVTPVPETIHTDPIRLRQILINLVGNAIKFTDHGEVKLVVAFQPGSSASTLQFDVIDTGIGMTPQQVDRLFQPFSQGDGSITRRFGGSGLGLAISRRLARLLGGDVQVVETTPDRGTRFRATLETPVEPNTPMIQDPPKATILATVRPKLEVRNLSGALTGARILLAEDGPDNQRLIALFLKKAGADVQVVEDGRQAVLAYRASMNERPFDVILMDMQMPVMGGEQATRLIRNQGYHGLIIALTAHAMSGAREKYLACGCDDYAAKPIDRENLITLIARRRAQTRTSAALPARPR